MYGLTYLGVFHTLTSLGIFGNRSLAIETVIYTSTFMFHMIPGVTESLTRLPYGRPMLASAEAPILQGITVAMLLACVAACWYQVRQLRQQSEPVFPRYAA